MSATDVPGSLVDFAGGDLATARLLRSSLAALREQLGDDPGSASLRRDVSAVLEGRMTMRDLAEVPAFRDLATEGMHQAEEAWRLLSPTERAAQIEAGTALIDDARA